MKQSHKWLTFKTMVKRDLVIQLRDINEFIFGVAMLPLLGVLLLASFASATLGLLVGTIVKPMQIAAMFTGFLMPLVFTGAIFFTWDELSVLLPVKYLVLINPLVYVNEALRAIMNTNIVSMPMVMSVVGIIAFTLDMGYFGFNRFLKLAKQ